MNPNNRLAQPQQRYMMPPRGYIARPIQPAPKPATGQVLGIAANTAKQPNFQASIMGHYNDLNAVNAQVNQITHPRVVRVPPPAPHPSFWGGSVGTILRGFQQALQQNFNNLYLKN